MALTNYLGNTYCIVDSIQCEKEAKFIRFDLRIYPNSSKTVVLANKNFSIAMQPTCWGIKQFGITQMPNNPTEGDCYILAKNGLHESIPEIYAGLRAIFNGSEWQYWSTQTHELLYDIVADKYVNYDFNSGTLTDAVNVNDSRLWDKFFCPSLIEANGIIKQCYTYLKSLPEFEDCVDV